jgi:hypothetical protein
VADGDHRDRTYTRARVADLRKNRMVWGVYHYGRVASAGNRQRDGRAEAKMAVGFAKEMGWGQPGDLRFTYDFEDANGQSAGKCAKHLIEFITTYRGLMGHLPIIYTMPGFWSSVYPHLSAKGRTLVKACPLWVAHWRVNRPRVPGPWNHYAIWQNNDRGLVPGVSGPCDVNQVRVSLGELTFGGAPTPTPKPTPTPEPKEPKVSGELQDWRDSWEYRRARELGYSARAKREMAEDGKVTSGTKWKLAMWTKRRETARRKIEELKGKAADTAKTGDYPKGLPSAYESMWDKPWEDRAAKHANFRKWLEANGYLSPHFRKSEARCKDGTWVPDSLNAGARNHAFNLEKLRHKLGDRPIAITSWYRTPSHNRKVGGASKSKHIQAFATDHPKQWVDAMGRKKVLGEADVIFRNGGMGVYPGGAVHFDTRGIRARWSSW